MTKETKILTSIVLIFAGAIIFNFFVDKNVRLKDFIRYPHSEIWSLDRAPRFKDFPVVEKTNYKFSEVDIDSNPSAREFRTTLRYASKDGANFAGHYAVAQWGCGSSCQDGMIIDLVSGKVYDPFTEATSRGIDYKLNSNLFITDPYSDDTPLVEEIIRIPVKYYIWKENKLIQIYQEECSLIFDDKYSCK